MGQSLEQSAPVLPAGQMQVPSTWLQGAPPHVQDAKQFSPYVPAGHSWSQFSPWYPCGHCLRHFPLAWSHNMPCWQVHLLWQPTPKKPESHLFLQDAPWYPGLQVHVPSLLPHSSVLLCTQVHSFEQPGPYVHFGQAKWQ